MRKLMLLLVLGLISCGSKSVVDNQVKNRVDVVKENIEKLNEHLIILAEQVPLNKWLYNENKNEYSCLTHNIEMSIDNVNLWIHTKEGSVGFISGLSQLNQNQINRISNLHEKLKEPETYNHLKTTEELLKEIISKEK